MKKVLQRALGTVVARTLRIEQLREVGSSILPVSSPFAPYLALFYFYPGRNWLVRARCRHVSLDRISPQHPAGHSAV